MLGINGELGLDSIFQGWYFEGFWGASAEFVNDQLTDYFRTMQELDVNLEQGRPRR